MALPPRHPQAGPSTAELEAHGQFQQALAYYNDGRAAKALALCENIVKKNPRYFDAFHLMGVLAHQAKNYVKAAYLIGKAIELYPRNPDFYSNRGLPLQELGQLDAAIASYDKAIALRPNFAEAYFNRGNALKDLKYLEGAVASYDKAIALRPDLVEAHFSRGIALQGLKRLDAAIASYDKAIALRPDYVEAHFNRASSLADLNKPQAAIAAYNTVITLSPGFAEAYCNRGNAFKELKELETAIADYDRAIAITPTSAVFYCNRGNVMQALRRYEPAVAAYDAAIALNPKFDEAHFNRGVVLQRLERWDEAVAGYDMAIALNPGYAEVYHNRGLVLRNLDRQADALESHAKAIELRPDHIDSRKSIFWVHFARLSDPALADRQSAEILALRAKVEGDGFTARKTIAGFRLLHDLEQTNYLLGLGTESDGLREANRRLADIWSRQQDNEGLTSYAIPVSDEEVADINRFRKVLLRYQPPDIKECLNPDNDWSQIEDQYFSSVPEMVYIDNLLTPRALQELRMFSLYSTIWKTEYKNQYLGAFAPEGFVSPLHFQIAIELRQKMPRIFADHALEQLWAFKYTQKMSTGINIHADFARVNLNFWLTPDDSILDPTTGGLVVYDVPSPASWSFQEYNCDEPSIYAFLEKNRAGKKRVPYKCNRAVLFNSNLFHETDELHFKDGYENRRINVTYLFGRGLRTL